MKIKPKILSFRSASIKDSDFIYNLRISKGEFLNNEGFTAEGNKKWVSSCSTREIEGKEYYFIISDKNENVGVVRLYNIDCNKKTFIWGSWILKDGCSPLYAVISSVMVYAFAFDYLKMEESILDVRNANLKVKLFHEKTGAKFLRKDELDTYYTFDKSDYIILKNRYDKYIGNVKYEEKP